MEKEESLIRNSSGSDMSFLDAYFADSDQLVELPTSQGNLLMLQDELHESYLEIHKKKELLQEIDRLNFDPIEFLQEAASYIREKDKRIEQLEKYINAGNKAIKSENIEKELDSIKTDLDSLKETLQENNAGREAELKAIDEVIKEIKRGEASQKQEKKEDLSKLSEDEIIKKRQKEWETRDDKTEKRAGGELARLDTSKAKIDIKKTKESKEIQQLENFYEALKEYIKPLEKSLNNTGLEPEKGLGKAKKNLKKRVENLRSIQTNEKEILKKVNPLVEGFGELLERNAKRSASKKELEKEKNKAKNLSSQYKKMAEALGIPPNEINNKINKIKKKAIEFLNDSSIRPVPSPLPNRHYDKPRPPQPKQGTVETKKKYKKTLSFHRLFGRGRSKRLIKKTKAYNLS